ncbi:hypothetical protein [Algivirga pacifica]|uniref:Outer membrane protein beta-barrel domain-containing protein n=1 Tax=Algivirga pacifica TaxID=1162670 RepID=A0ABP9DS39_9BACT
MWYRILIYSLLLSLVLWLPKRCTAQVSEDTAYEANSIPLKDRFFFGGNVGFQFGDITAISLAPLVGFRITEAWQAGTVLSYTYYKENFPGYTYETNIIGGRLFTRYLIDIYNGLRIFPHGELLTNRFKQYNPFSGEEEPNWYTTFLLGGGVQFPIGGRGGLNMLALYDLDYNRDTSFEDSPWVFRVEVVF